jgi:hypothetical protein
MKEVSTEGGFAFCCLFASMIYAAAGEINQCFFFFACSLVFIFIDIHRSK